MADNPGFSELRTVRVSDIAEYPTALGSRCLLLQKLGLDAYVNTEEELLCALSESARHPEHLDTCLKSSRCKAFWNQYQQGVTPYIERDPIHLVEFNGRYWVSEGKHRVCLAKRAGIDSIEAYVYPMAKDSYALLPPAGTPGVYRFHAEYAKAGLQRAYG